MKSNTAFVDWINRLGTLKISEMLDVHQSAVRHWRGGVCLPTARQMKRIKELTKGKIGYAEIIEGATSPVNQKGI